MPTWLIERRYRFGIYSSDCDEAPHVHVTGHGGRGKIWLAPFGVEYLRGYNPGQRATIVRLAVEHQARFREQWDEFCDQRTTV